MSLVRSLLVGAPLLSTWGSFVHAEDAPGTSLSDELPSG